MGTQSDRTSAVYHRQTPLRFTFDNNYFNDRRQGIPEGGYNVLFDKLLENADVRTDTDYFADRAALEQVASKTVFTGALDEYFGKNSARWSTALCALRPKCWICPTSRETP